MSIQPPSDIVLDVAKAADPVKSMEAAQRLLRPASGGEVSGEFADVLENITPPRDNTTDVRSRLSLIGGAASTAGARPSDSSDPRVKAYQSLEALIFQNLFETTLPHDESLGAGMAGDVWRSMLAEQLGKQVAKTVDLGILPKSLASSSGPSAKPRPGASLAQPVDPATGETL